MSIDRPSGDAYPFSRRNAWAFYLSLFARYKGRLLALGVFMIVFAVFTALRLGAVGVVLDAVRIHLEAAGRADPGDLEGASRLADGTAVESFNHAWDRVMPAGWTSPMAPEALRTSDGFWFFLTTCVIGIALLALGLGVFHYVKETIAISVVVHTLMDTRRALFDHLTGQSVAYFHCRRSGDLISRVTNDVDTVQSALHHLFQTFIQQPAVVISSLIVAYWASPFLFAIFVPLLFLMAVPIIRSGRQVIYHGRQRQKKLGLITESLQQLFGGIRIVKAFGMERYEREAFHQKNKTHGRSFRRTLQAQVMGRSVQEILYNLGLAGLLFLGGWLLTSDADLSMGKFFTFVVAMVQIYSPIKVASRAWNRIQESRAGVERVLEVLRSEPALRDRPGAGEFPGIRESIRFERVSFSYRAIPEFESDHALADSGRPPMPAISGIDFEVRRGEMAALVGPSGSGKTTIVDLLARFYEPQQGSIRVDGVDVREYQHASYLDHVAIVSQDPFLFNTTIRENILYGKEHATEDELVAAAKAANAHEFILEQPEGYDTEIGDRGARLSGGQRQRLTIARALLKNAPILILDEATSALDSEAEKEVQKAIDNLVRDRTTFVIAHRLSTIADADKIIVLDRGRIVEQGTHAELLAEGGRYHALYMAQNPPERAVASRPSALG